jgi:predicted ATPase/class 3 adenylate cyclase
MALTRFPTGTVSFLFTDIEGSTRLWETDPTAMRVALARHDEILRAAIEQHGGVVFKTVGDAFCAAFSRAGEALAAAIDAQRGLAQEAWPGSIDRIRVRAGIHTGTVTESGGDYFGPTVNRVARLMSVGYGDQILVSSVTAALLRDALPASTALRDLGTHRLKDLSEPEPTYQVVAPGLRTDFPALRSMDSRPNNLPFQISTFVGREQELRELRDALAERRLVTIVGSGGIGKTRLALQVAADVIERFGDGAWLVSLARLGTGDLIGQATADVLRVREAPQERIDETLARDLADRQILLVLDSAEHLLAPVATFVKMLLNRCGGLKILVTSREPLHLTGEHVVRVGALTNGAELLLDRAREVVVGFVADDVALAAVDEICRRLEGIPLAIELAAARTATMPLTELNVRLAKRLSILVSRDTTKEERHRTLRATIAWSYGLLDAREAAVFAALGVFGGTFDIGGVCAVAQIPEEDALDLIEALIGKSLVSLDSGQDTRYTLLDTVREFLVELVSADGSLADLCRRHFEHYASLISTLVAGSSGVGAALLDAIEAEMNNVRAALAWAIRERPADGAVLATNVSRYWKIRGHITEGRTWFRRFIENPAVEGAVRAALLRRAATFATEQDAYEEARSFSEECRALYERLGDIGGMAEASHNLAVIEQRCGNLDAAADHYASAIARFREAHHTYGEAVALMNMVLLAFARDDLSEAERYIDEAAAAAARNDNADLPGYIGGFRGELALRRGDVDAAAELFRDALALKRALGNRYDVGDMQNSLAVVYLRQGRISDARAAAAETLRTALDLDAGSLFIFGLEAFCEIAIHDERYDDAARYYGLARALRIERSYRPSVRDMNAVENLLRAKLRGRFDAILESVQPDELRPVAEELARAQ